MAKPISFALAASYLGASQLAVATASPMLVAEPVEPLRTFGPPKRKRSIKGVR